jgi:hypothetical protein
MTKRKFTRWMILIPCFFLIGWISPLSAAISTDCTAIVDKDYKLHIPYLSYNDPQTGPVMIWVDFTYTHNPSYPSMILFKLSNHGIIANPSFTCPASTVFSQTSIHIPDLLMPDGVTHYWVNLTHNAALSTQDSSIFAVSNWGHCSLSETGKFDLTQTAFIFSFIANAPSNVTGSPQQLADYSYDALTNGTPDPSPYVNSQGERISAPGLLKTIGSKLIGGDWTLVWGPGDFQLEGSDNQSDNAAFIVYSPSQDTYILAMAGTNPNGLLDWLVEDLVVGPEFLVKWPLAAPLVKPTPVPIKNINPADRMISGGTAYGVYYTLTSMVQAQQSPSQGQTLEAYLPQLKQNQSGTTRLLVTGHSLGGALSPTIANWAQDKLSQADPAWNGQVSAMPTAGPTPGNAAYAADWDAKFPTRSVTVNPGNIVNKLNALLYNQCDIVPYAWQHVVQLDIGTEHPDFFWNVRISDKKYYYESQIGQLVLPVGIPSDTLTSAIYYAQMSGRLAGMTRQKNLIEINDTTLSPATAWPIQYLNSKQNNQLEYFQKPTPPITDIRSFFGDIGTVHVWGYFSAFNIDLAAIKDALPVRR